MKRVMALAVLLACGGGEAGEVRVPPEQPAAVVLEPPVAEVPAHYFGINYVAAWASPAPWPEAAGLYRVHDATPRWHRLHTGPGQWDSAALHRLDAVLLFRERNAPDLPVIYVLAGGGVPAWVADTATAWREHVRFIAARYAGSIQFYEVWNEPDSRAWFGGSVEQLVALTRIASAEVRALDPDARIIGPSFTDQGLAMLEAFYGHDVDVDIVGWHHGVVDPEAGLETIAAVRAALARQGVERPLWATEMNVRGGASELARTYLLHWLGGVEQLGYYSWEMPSYGMGGAFAHTADVDGQLTAAGRAFITVQRWMTGRRVLSASADSVWQLELDDGSRIVWAPGGRTWTVPDGVVAIEALDGTSRAPGGSTIALEEPVRFR